MKTSVELPFADGIYSFRLTLEGIQEIQSKAGVGFGEVFARLLAGRYDDGTTAGFGLPTEAKWDVRDVINVIRQGLIGGGAADVDGEKIIVDPVTANRLIAMYIGTGAHPWKEAWDLAAAIAFAAVEGIEDRQHEVKKKPARSRVRKTTDGSTTPSRSASSPA
jgi:hypothetical protein